MTGNKTSTVNTNGYAVSTSHLSTVDNQHGSAEIKPPVGVSACRRAHSATQQFGGCKSGRCKHSEHRAPWEGGCVPPDPPVNGELIRTAASMEGPQQTAARISLLPQGTAHTETRKLALLWAYGPTGLRHEGQATVLLSFPSGDKVQRTFNWTPSP